jgi:uncharacterized protein (DUF58 family)
MVKAWKVLVGVGAAGAAGYLVWKYVIPFVTAFPAPPGFSVKSVEVTPASVALGKPVIVRVTVENGGTVSGKATVKVTANGAEIKRFNTPEIFPGKTDTYEFDWAPPEEKIYEVCAEFVR